MRQMANSELTLDDVPTPNAGWPDLAEFALTFNGYAKWGSFEKCAEIANAQLGNTLTELRTCLFFEARRWRHFGYDPDEDAMAYLHSVVEQIRKRVAAADLV